MLMLLFDLQRKPLKYRSFMMLRLKPGWPTGPGVSFFPSLPQIFQGPSEGFSFFGYHGWIRAWIR